MRKSYRADGIVINSKGHIALVNEHLWGFPRGGVEEGEDYITAAKREILEEIGLDEFGSIEDLHTYERYPRGIDENTPGSYPMEIHMFLFKVKGEPRLNPKSRNIKGVGWFSYEEALKKLQDEKDREFLSEYIGKIDI
jgi:8-oxo-dGTP pyrophosphatase MutT (NUDIX family)